MEKIVRTVYDALIQTAESLNKQPVLPTYSTLNEKFGIHTTTHMSATDNLSIGYVGIGIGGVRFTTGNGNVPLKEAIQHLASDAGLYNQIPFILRLPANDLTPTERLNYRLRRLEDHDGITYVAYYLKKLNLDTVIPGMELRTITAGVTTSQPFLPTLDNLNPVQPTSGSIVNTTNRYLVSTAKVDFTISAHDLVEIKNVCQIIYNDPNYALISEIALCRGVDKTVTGDFNGTLTSYTDAVDVTVSNFINTLIPAIDLTQDVTMTLDIGNVEPLYSI